MDKPKQAGILRKNVANDELMQCLEDAMYDIASAMENLRGIDDFAPWFDTLDGLYEEMVPDYELCKQINAAEYDEEIMQMTRDYYRSVI